MLLGKTENRFFPACLLLCGLLVLWQPRLVPAQNARSRGLIPLRKFFPTDLLFLALPAANPHLRIRRFSWQIRYAQSNAFVLSGAVRETLPAQGRRMLFTRELAEALHSRNPQADNYLIDLEVQRAALYGQYRPVRWLVLGGEIPFLRYTGGSLDPVIEKFHETFGVPDGGRPDFAENLTQFFFNYKGEMLYLDGTAFGRFGIGDIAVSAGLLLTREPGDWPLLMLQFALKLPTGRHRALRGSGSVDIGLSLSAEEQFGRNVLTFRGELVKPGNWQAIPSESLASFYGFEMAYERLFGQRWSLLVQAHSVTNAFTGKTRAGISGFSHEVSLGAKIDLSVRLRLAAAIVENYAYFRNSPDLGVFIGLENRLR